MRSNLSFTRFPVLNLVLSIALLASGNLAPAMRSDSLDVALAIPVLDPARISFQEITSGLSSPVFITHAKDGSGRIFVVEQAGRIRIIKNGALQSASFLDIVPLVKSTFSEQGLLGLAFHPSYASNGKFYVIYTAPRPGDSNGSILTLRQYSVSTGNPNLANSASGTTILTIDHPAYSNHNGGTIAFGNDGYLYWSTGDGGSAGDPNNNAQTLTSLLGKILRIDVNAGSPYTIPPDNPFYGSSDPGIKKEIWAYGLRNPWRMSFDRLTHDLYIGDVGQGDREEVDFQAATSPGGENYGWRVMEGSQCYPPSSGCDQTGKVFPVAEYDHSLGCSVTGGHVYRGAEYPSLYGFYFYGDFCSGRLFSIYNDLPAGWSTPVQLADTVINISTFGEDENGELYLAHHSAGRIYKIRYEEPSFTISGNAGANGATLSYLDETPRVATAQPDGSYRIFVPGGWSGTITPAHPCYTFEPLNRGYNNVVANYTGQDYTATFDPASGCADVDVTIGANPMGSFGVASTPSAVTNHPGVLGGPVQVTSTNAKNIITSQRAVYGNSFNELMGYPANKFTTEYWFPWYDQVYMNTWVLVGNPSSTQTAYVDIYIGGVQRGSYSILPGDRVLPQFPGVLDGPVRVVSVTGAGTSTPLPIFASERSIYGSSFNEVMGYPANQLTTEYWFPWYDQVYMNTWILVGNPSSTQTAYVDIYIGGVKRGSYPIPPNGRVLPQFPDLLNGPVRVVSTTGSGTPTPLPVFASERSTYQGSFNEVMGYPADQLTTEYWYTWYDNLGMASWLLVGNPSSSQTAYVDIYIGGVKQGPARSIPPQGNIIPRFNTSTGPVRVVSVTGGGTSAPISIFTSERSLYGPSFNEMMGYPANQLTTEYWFTWYDSIYMNTDLYISKP